jgi:4-amino-4-deoxy-L-arabinose transferase-like glycosyltransferase
MMSKMNIIYCCILIIAAFGIRILFAYLQPAVLVLPDSRGYYALGQIMFERPSPATIVNPYRTPGYPFFLAAAARTVRGNDNTPEAPMSLRLAQAVTTWQTVISVISLVILFLTLVSVFRNPLAAFLFSLFQGLNPLLFIWEHSMLTEGLAVSLSTIALCLAFFALRRPAPVRLILLTVFCIIIFLIRPAFMIAPLAFFPLSAVLSASLLLP